MPDSTNDANTAMNAVESLAKTAAETAAKNASANTVKNMATSNQSANTAKGSPVNAARGGPVTKKPKSDAPRRAAVLSTLTEQQLQSLEISGQTIRMPEDFAPDSVPTSLRDAPSSLQQAEPADGIEILCKLAESGEIDPKNVDIIDVTDKFLKAIAAAPKENLRQSGKVLFHACVLLRMKAEALLAATVDESGDDFMDFEDGDGPIIYDSNEQAVGRQITLIDLERALVRKAHTRQNRQRRVTLDQLIAALRQAETIEKTRAEKQPRAPRIDLGGYHEVNDVDDILDLAHDEDVESTIERVEGILCQYLNTGETMHLIEIIRLLDRFGDWVDAFLAILFMSNAGKITIEQQEFWGPLYVVRCDPSAQQSQSTGTAS